MDEKWQDDCLMDYVSDASTRPLKMNPAAAGHVRQMFQMAAAGKRPKEIAECAMLPLGPLVGAPRIRDCEDRTSQSATPIAALKNSIWRINSFFVQRASRNSSGWKTRPIAV
jgi:hypothetical protein